MNITQSLIVACIIIFLGQMIIGPVFEDFLVLRGIELYEQPYLILTSMFAHGGLHHIAFNMLALFIFGSALERKLGGGNFLVLYLVSGVLGGIGFMLLSNPFSSAVGASGAIYGIIGAVALLMPNMRILLMGIPMPMYIAGFLYMAIELIGLGASDGIAHSAHLLGLFGGIAIAYWINKNRVDFDVRKAAAAGVILALLAGFSFGFYYENDQFSNDMAFCQEGTVTEAVQCYAELSEEYEDQPEKREIACREYAKFRNYMLSGYPNQGGQAYEDCMKD